MARIDFRSVGGSATLSYASNSNDVGTTSAAGASTLVSRADHVHAGATLSYASNSTQVADANAAGASTLVSRADHRHMGVAAITSSSSNTMTDPTVNLRAGDNIGFALNVATNTLTISGAAGGTGTSISYASNSNAVGTANAAGASALVSRADHVHAGYSIITSSSSNTLSPSTLNLRAGTGIAFGLDASSTNSTLTISNIGGGGGGGTSSGISSWCPPVLQSVTNYQASGTTNVLTVTAPTKALLAVVQADSRGATSISQTNVTWTQRYTGNASSMYFEVWTGAISGSAGTSVTANFALATKSQLTVFELDRAALTAVGTAATGSGQTMRLTLTGESDGALVIFGQTSFNANNSTTICNAPFVAASYAGCLTLGLCYFMPLGIYAVITQSASPTAFGAIMRVS